MAHKPFQDQEFADALNEARELYPERDGVCSPIMFWVDPIAESSLDAKSEETELLRASLEIDLEPEFEAAIELNRQQIIAAHEKLESIGHPVYFDATISSTPLESESVLARFGLSFDDIVEYRDTDDGSISKNSARKLTERVACSLMHHDEEYFGDKVDLALDAYYLRIFKQRDGLVRFLFAYANDEREEVSLRVAHAE